MADTLIKVIIKTINNETFDYEVPKDLPVTQLKEKVRVNK